MPSHLEIDDQAEASMQIANDFTALITELVWRDEQGGIRTDITYGFADRPFSHHIPETTPQMRASVQAFTAEEMAVVRAAFRSWDKATVIDLTEVAAEEADIIITLTDFRSDTDLDDTLGFAFQPEGDELDGDVFIDLPFSDDLPLYIHEIGHSLGLDHTFDGDRIFGDLSLDRIENTIMGEADFDDATGPGAFDIQAIQFMYADGAPGPVVVADTTADASSVADFLIGGDDADQIAGLRGGDTIIGGRGADTLRGGGGEDDIAGDGGRDDIAGGGRGDTLDGGGGRDQISGNGGRDLLLGGGGRDALNGGAGADTLNGGRGRDEMTGGNGADLFVFSNGGPRDTITDFTFDIDQIQFVGANSFDDLIFSDIADGAIVRFGNAKVLVEGIDSFELIEDDFLF